MKIFKVFLFLPVFAFSWSTVSAQEIAAVVKNDSIILAQAFLNLTLTKEYFEELSEERISKILGFETGELASIQDSSFQKDNSTLYHFSYALLYYNQSKFLFRTKSNANREELIQWKNALEKAMEHFKASKMKASWDQPNEFFELIMFDEESFDKLPDDLLDLKSLFTPYFNENIYPDFQRIYYQAKNKGEYDFEGLKASAGIYNLGIDFSLLDNKEYPYPSFSGLSNDYFLFNKLNLVSNYLQFDYLASDQFKIPSGFDVDQLYFLYNEFLNALKDEEDRFIVRELNAKTIKSLFKKLQKRFPYNFERFPSDFPVGMTMPPNKEATGQQFYFFPELAPLASVRLIKSNFKPELKTLGSANEFLRREFNLAGYKDQLQYYYASDGFAITTSLERFNLDGSAVPVENRFVKSLTEQRKFSYYEIFKSMFFDLEFDYRMFALVISSKATTMSKNAMTPEFATQIIENSYDVLPETLTNKELSNKTLSVFVYHFNLNANNGTVGLDLTGKISAQDYLKNAGLLRIIQ